jgi:chaperonin GroEL (HSP60 family)
MELSKELRAYSKTIKSKLQLIIASFAKSLEVISNAVPLLFNTISVTL